MTFNLKESWGYDKAMTPASPTVTTLTRLECVIGSVTHMTMNLGHPNGAEAQSDFLGALLGFLNVHQ